MIMLNAGEALFLRCGHDFTIDDQAGGRVVIEGRDAKNAYHARISRLEERIDERRDSRTLSQHKQGAN
jgi:hypothetical protein